MSLPRSCMTSQLQMKCRALWPFTRPSRSWPVALTVGWCGPSAWLPPICWWSTSKGLQQELHRGRSWSNWGCPGKSHGDNRGGGQGAFLELDNAHVPAECFSGRDNLLCQSSGGKSPTGEGCEGFLYGFPVESWPTVGKGLS